MAPGALTVPFRHRYRTHTVLSISVLSGDPYRLGWVGGGGWGWGVRGPSHSEGQANVGSLTPTCNLRLTTGNHRPHLPQNLQFAIFLPLIS